MFPTLTAAQIKRIAAQGHVRRMESGEVLIEAGEQLAPFFVITAGQVEVVLPSGTTETLITVHGPGQFTGEVNMLSGRPALVRTRAIEPGEVIEMDHEHLLALVQTDSSGVVSKSDERRDDSIMTLVLAFLIGFFAGLRSLIAPATAAWAVHLGWLKLESPLSLIGSVPSVAIFTLLAVLETRGRTAEYTESHGAPGADRAYRHRRSNGGACVAAGGGQAAVLGAAIGAAGGIVGCFAGYQLVQLAGESTGTRRFLRHLLLPGSTEKLIAVVAASTSLKL